jgi:hypothetical protein
MSVDARTLSKVPAVTLGFWIIKILATTLGETGGDTVTGIAPPSWTVDRLGGLRGHGKFLGGLLLIVDGRLVSNR